MASNGVRNSASTPPTTTSSVSKQHQPGIADGPTNETSDHDHCPPEVGIEVAGAPDAWIVCVVGATSGKGRPQIALTIEQEVGARHHHIAGLQSA
jgi:hypothetical protein